MQSNERLLTLLSRLTDPTAQTAWTPGPAAQPPTASPTGPLVSYTEFTFDHFRDLPKIVVAALRLRRELVTLSGARGVLLYVRPLSRRLGSLSAWDDATALGSFVSLPFHVEIMRTYRSRGTLRSATFSMPEFDPSAALAEARVRVPDQSSGAVRARRALAASRIAVGLSCVLAPRVTARLLLGLGVENGTRVWARLFGVRDLTLGHAALSPVREVRRSATMAGMACDAVDAASALAAGRAGELTGRQTALLTALPLAALALGRAGLEPDTTKTNNPSIASAS